MITVMIMAHSEYNLRNVTSYDNYVNISIHIYIYIHISLLISLSLLLLLHTDNIIYIM